MTDIYNTKLTGFILEVHMFKYVRNAMLFQGRNKNKRYFEGWYFKQVSADAKCTISVIPGIAKDVGDPHAFIQTIINREVNGEGQITTHYHKFPTRDFIFADEPFSLHIGNNTFSELGIELDLADDSYSLKGKILFSKLTKIKTSALSPNSMGYFGYLPFMECYHGIVSMNHYLTGTLVLNEENIDFDSGKGYIEKDWGTSFPTAYIWIQSNNFEHKDASVMCSIANIPFIGLSFEGFICNVSLGDQEYRFANYNHSKILKSERTDNTVFVTITNKDMKLEVSAKMQEGGTLKAPKNGAMLHTIKEGLNGVVSVKLIKNSGEVLFEGVGNPCGIELVKSLDPIHIF
jgi:hypothetical protein